MRSAHKWLLFTLLCLGACAHRPTKVQSPPQVTIVFLHGFADYSGTWKALGAALGADYRIVAPDLRGYNSAPQPSAQSDYALQKIAEDVIALIGEGPVYLAGHDWGALVAYAVAERVPGKVLGVISFGAPHPKAYFTSAPGYLRKYADGKEPDWEKLFAWRKPFPDYAEYLEAMKRSSRPGMLAYYRENFRPEIMNREWKIAAPVLIFDGWKDPNVPRRAFRNAGSHFPGGLTRVSFADGGHDLHLEAPAETAAAIHQWIRRTRGGHVTIYDRNLPKAYSVKIHGAHVYALGGPVRKYSEATGERSEIFGDQNNIDLAVDGQKVIVAADFEGAANTSGPGRIFEVGADGGNKVVAEEPNIHRLRWFDRDTLIAASMAGHGAKENFFTDKPARLLALQPRARWKSAEISGDLTLLHGIFAAAPSLYTASKEGLTEFRREGMGWTKTPVAPGAGGAGEVTAGHRHGAALLASVEPWHGAHLAVYTRENGKWTRAEIAHASTGGHGIEAVDVDGDGSDELVSCFMGENPGVYLHKFAGGAWLTSVLQTGFSCQGIAVRRRPLAVFAAGGTQVMKIEFSN